MQAAARKGRRRGAPALIIITRSNRFIALLAVPCFHPRCLQALSQPSTTASLNQRSQLHLPKRSRPFGSLRQWRTCRRDQEGQP